LRVGGPGLGFPLDPLDLRSPHDAELLIRDLHTVAGIAVLSGSAGNEDTIVHRRHWTEAGDFIAVTVQQLDMSAIGEAHAMGILEAVVHIEHGPDRGHERTV